MVRSSSWTVYDFRHPHHFDAPYALFDFQARSFRRYDAEINATRAALNDALEFFWYIIDSDKFAAICKALLDSEGIQEISCDARPPDCDFLGELLVAEPAGFRREERWAFKFKHHRVERISAHSIREAEEHVEELDGVDVLCLLTSGDLTSIGNHVTVHSSRVRVWDRQVLNVLVNRHLTVLEPHFALYPAAMQRLDEEFRNRGGPRLETLREELLSCAFGKEYFAQYEQIGTQALTWLFSHTLGPAREQTSTKDGVQRRDVVYRNLQGTPFFRRVASRFEADFLIVDFKNYAKPIGAAVIESVAKYANKALGRFLLLLSRKGAASGGRRAQERIFRDSGAVVLVLSDEQLLEMVARKERGENPEDVLEDILDELLLRF